MPVAGLAGGLQLGGVTAGQERPPAAVRCPGGDQVAVARGKGDLPGESRVDDLDLSVRLGVADGLDVQAGVRVGAVVAPVSGEVARGARLVRGPGSAAVLQDEVVVPVRQVAGRDDGFALSRAGERD